MSVTLDAVSTGAGTSPSWSHTCASGCTILSVQVGDFVGSDAEASSSITYNGVALTLLTAYKAFNTARTSYWYLLNPASGTHTIAVTSASTVTFVASSWLGGDTSTPHGTPVTNTGNSNAPASGSITGAATSMLIANTGNLTDNLTQGAGQTLLAQVTTGGFHCDAAYKAGSGSATTFSWTGYTSDTRWAASAIELKAPATGVPGQLATVGVGK